MNRLFSFMAIALLSSTAAFADIAPGPGKSGKRTPKPVTINTEMDISLDRDATEARLIIPRSQLTQLRAELDALDSNTENTAGLTSVGGGFQNTETIVSALFLSLAFAFGGIWYLRSSEARSRPGRGAIAAAIIAVTASAATFVFANAGPPPSARSITGKMFSDSVHAYGFGWGKIKLEAGDGRRVQLIVPNPKTAATPAPEE